MSYITVFIVEDDPMVLSINQEYTEKIPSFKVIGTSSNQNDAFLKIKDLKPDLILLDIFLPKGSGLALLKQIRQQKIAVDIILVTAAKDSSTVFESLRYGAVDYLVKPFGFERLKKSLLNFQKLKQLKDGNVPLSQEDIDGIILPGGQASLITSLPKGVHNVTLEQLLHFLSQQKEGLTCNQIASSLSLSKITAWRYLEYLADKGKVEVQLDHGQIGRPTKKYVISKTAKLSHRIGTSEI